MTEEVRKKIEQYGAEVDCLSIGGDYDKLTILVPVTVTAMCLDYEHNMNMIVLH